MPDEGFEKNIKNGLSFKEYKRINDCYNAMIIGARPFTLWDTSLFGLIPFRLANEEERLEFKENFSQKLIQLT